ncbi:MAG: L,D-transpeptidase family protein [Magnetococcales bacterium]|nr:L,D-transpeptidase family protein [Magnetococcales bacterium]
MVTLSLVFMALLDPYITNLPNVPEPAIIQPQFSIPQLADRVVVYKQRRLLELWSQGDRMHQYPIALGKNATGAKQKEGDLRTPEGRYTLDWRNNVDSLYHLSMHISYPNATDQQWADQRGFSPGGLIMIHGQPNWLAGFAPVYRPYDWTLGCIAVSNVAMEEIWRAVLDGTPIDIYP